MEPPKFSPEELNSLVTEAISWLLQQRELFLPSSIPLDGNQKKELQPFFPAEILGQARILDVSQTGESIPYPPFYERVRAGGARVVPDAAPMNAMSFVDVMVFNRQPRFERSFIIWFTWRNLRCWARIA